VSRASPIYENLHVAIPFANARVIVNINLNSRIRKHLPQLSQRRFNCCFSGSAGSGAKDSFFVPTTDEVRRRMNPRRAKTINLSLAMLAFVCCSAGKVSVGQFRGSQRHCHVRTEPNGPLVGSYTSNPLAIIAIISTDGQRVLSNLRASLSLGRNRDYYPVRKVQFEAIYS